MLREGAAADPQSAWNQAVEIVLPGKRASQAKSCPRAAFLTLCELGVVPSIPPGSYTRSVKNRRYVERALE
ncbi:DUF6979 family protein, partial [Salmonella enterica subsp. enterica serovar Typhimurium]|uniref:DUF6979 family protein n=1 Tax=Salmonella enterica TaxID=28901 RepID=UPI0039ED0A34